MFVHNLYVENCSERAEHGMPLYDSSEEYYQENKMFIQNKYFEQDK
jgi:hypothetical protein